jgi:ketosteroid isomerase-like protein
MTERVKGEVIQAFERYAADFARLDARAVALHYHEPALFIGPPGAVALATHADVERFFRQVMAELPGRGYAGTELVGLTEQRLQDDLALFRGTGIWRNAAGQELQRFGMTYTWRRTGPTPSDWRIVVAMVHEPPGD